MAEQIVIVGWLDPEMPARWREEGACEFRLRLSAVPSSSWKKSFGDHGRNQSAEGLELIEKDHMVLCCELDDIEPTIARIKRQIELTNQAVARLEREVTERGAVHRRAEEEQRKKILAAVSRIRFDAAPGAEPGEPPG